MSCPIRSQENAEILLRYCARKLDPATTAVLERHMQTCPACRNFQEEQQAVWRALDAWEAMPASSDFDRRLYRRIDELDQVAWWRRWVMPVRPMLVRQGVPLAAAAFLIIAGILLERPADISAPSPRPGVRVESVAADQVERTLDDFDLLQQFGQATGAERRSL